MVLSKADVAHDTIPSFDLERSLIENYIYLASDAAGLHVYLPVKIRQMLMRMYSNGNKI